MTHDVTVSSAECAECNIPIHNIFGHDGPSRERQEQQHLQAQKDAWWRRGQIVTNSDNPLKVLNDAKPPEDCCRGAAPDQHCECAKREAAIIRRAQMEAKK